MGKHINLFETKTKEELLELYGEFLEYLIDKYAMFERKAESDPHYSGIGDYINIKGVVAEYFGTEKL